MKKMIAVLVFMLMALSSRFAFSADSEFKERLEPLCGIEVNNGSLSFIAAQCGYTERRSFRIEVFKNGENQELKIFRVREDLGKMLPQRERYTVPVAEVKLDPNKPVLIMNPIIGNEMLIHISKKSAPKKEETVKKDEIVKNTAEVNVANNEVDKSAAAVTTEVKVQHKVQAPVQNKTKSKKSAKKQNE